MRTKSGGSAAVDGPAQKCTATGSSSNDSKVQKVVVPSSQPFLTQFCTGGTWSLMYNMLEHSQSHSLASKAAKKSLAGDAKRKYFEHTGALITDDGSGDDLLNSMETPRMRASSFHLLL